jgi:ubiquinone/menaquinone biosynthesis C-methylase UbiE
MSPIQFYRVLKPNGLAVSAVWSTLEEVLVHYEIIAHSITHTVVHILIHFVAAVCAVLLPLVTAVSLMQ